MISHAVPPQPQGPGAHKRPHPLESALPSFYPTPEGLSEAAEWLQAKFRELQVCLVQHGHFQCLLSVRLSTAWSHRPALVLSCVVVLPKTRGWTKEGRGDSSYSWRNSIRPMQVCVPTCVYYVKVWELSRCGLLLSHVTGTIIYALLWNFIYFFFSCGTLIKILQVPLCAEYLRPRSYLCQDHLQSCDISVSE